MEKAFLRGQVRKTHIVVKITEIPNFKIEKINTDNENAKIVNKPPRIIIDGAA